MIIAELEYGKHYSGINFYGEDDVVELLNELESLIHRKQADENLLKIECLSKHREDNYAKLLELRKEIKDFKKEHLFWMFDKELREHVFSLKEDCSNFAANDVMVNIAIKQIYNDYINCDKTTDEFKNLLVKLGFACKTSSLNDGGDLSTPNKYIFESTCTDDQLRQSAEIILDEIKKERESEYVKIEEQYSDSHIIESLDMFCM